MTHCPICTRRSLVAGVGASALAMAGLAGCATDGSPDPAPAPSSPTGGGGGPLAKTGDIPVGGGKVFADAQTVITQPTAGEFKAFSAICTHQGCPVTEVTDTINCPCHGSTFAIADGSVTGGPATAPLPAKQVSVAGDSITVTG